MSNQPRIFFWTQWKRIDPNSTVGGPLVLQQNARILRDAGFDARIIVADRNRLRRPWRSRDDLDCGLGIRASEFKRVVRPDDLVVVPAYKAKETNSLPGARKALFVQNLGHLFRHLPLGTTTPYDSYPWLSSDLEAIVCVSRRDQETLKLYEPECPVLRVQNSVDATLFRNRRWQDREPLVLLSPLKEYKNPQHVQMLAHLVTSRALARGRMPPVIREIRDVPRHQMPELLASAKALIFLSLNEGFGLLPLEALLSGTPVIGYENQAYCEFVPDEYQFPVSAFSSMVDKLEDILAEEGGPAFENTRDKIRDAALRYSVANQVASVTATWGALASQVCGSRQRIRV